KSPFSAQSPKIAENRIHFASSSDTAALVRRHRHTAARRVVQERLSAHAPFRSRTLTAQSVDAMPCTSRVILSLPPDDGKPRLRPASVAAGSQGLRAPELEPVAQFGRPFEGGKHHLLVVAK